MITKQKQKLLKKKANTLQAIIQIGKSGASEGTINEIKRQLKARKTIKIKFLKSIVAQGAKQEMIHKIVSETHATLLTTTGSVITLYKD